MSPTSTESGQAPPRPPEKHVEHLESAVIRSSYDVHKVPMTRLGRDAVAGLGLSPKEASRCKNFFALGLVYWLYERDKTTTIDWIKDRYKKNKAYVEANIRAVEGGYNYG